MLNAPGGQQWSSRPGGARASSDVNNLEARITGDFKASRRHLQPAGRPAAFQNSGGGAGRFKLGAKFQGLGRPAASRSLPMIPHQTLPGFEATSAVRDGPPIIRGRRAARPVASTATGGGAHGRPIPWQLF